jgi:hypothetical protein
LANSQWGGTSINRVGWLALARSRPIAPALEDNRPEQAPFLDAVESGRNGQSGVSRDDEGNLIEGKGGEAGRRLLARLLSIPHLAAARPKLQLGRRGDVPSQILKVGGACA